MTSAKGRRPPVSLAPPMILTNSLLGIAFSLVADFTNAVPVPPNEVPTCVQDLARYHVGSPFWPVDLVLIGRDGTEFDIQHGVVTFFASARSYMHSVGVGSLPRFRGAKTVGEDQAAATALRAVRLLARHGDPTASLRAKVRHLKEGTDGPDLPFYVVYWPDPGPDGPSPAQVEIDARDGRITSVFLGDYAFYDIAFSVEMKRRVWLPDSLPPKEGVGEPSRSPRPPTPSTNEVLQALSSWSWLCDGLGLDCGVGASLAAVNWDNTYLYTNAWVSSTSPVCRVTFTNRSWFDAVGGVASDAFSPGSCYINEWGFRVLEDWLPFEGKVNRRWGDVAGDLEQRLETRLGIPRQLLAKYERHLRNTSVPGVGETGLKRVLVNWNNGAPVRVEYRGGAVWAWENHLGFSAELDVGTGELKFIRFCDPALIEALARAQRSRQSRPLTKP